MIDTHCHLTDPRLLEQLDEVFERARVAGVGRMITIGTDLADDRAAVALCRGRPNLRCAVGIHPNYTQDATLADVALLRELQADAAVVGVGGGGGYYFHKVARRAHQRDLFERQKGLGGGCWSPLVN